MHPYRMQTLIMQRGKDQIANVTQRNSVYQTIDALQRAGLIAISETSRDSRRPERTVYGATKAGRQALRLWVRNGLSTVAREYPEFPAVIATLYGVDSTEDLGLLLAARAEALHDRLKGLETPYPTVPRLFLLESEHMAAVARAEIKWLRGVIADLRSGKLAFPSEAQIRQISVELGAPSSAATTKILKEIRASSQSSKGARGPGHPAIQTGRTARQARAKIASVRKKVRPSDRIPKASLRKVKRARAR
jgi:DNA-binding PadR family transcriptional regulator